jgi:hypothetical protein
VLIYLDANIVQFCADYSDFVFGREGATAESQSQDDALGRSSN